MTFHHASRFPIALSSFLILHAASPARLVAQGSSADYERAEALPKLTSGKVFRERVEPHWTAEGTAFWYRVDLAGGGREFIWVDAEKGTRQPVFDHAKVAAQIKELLKKEVSAKHLPFSGLESEEGGVRFLVEGRWLHWDLAAEKLSAVEGGKVGSSPQQVEIHPSRQTGPETQMVIVNRNPFPVQIYWVDPSGKWKNYGGVRPQEEHSQHTFAGHVWLVVSGEGQVLAAYEASVGGSRVEVGPDTPPPPKKKDRRRREKEESNQSKRYQAELKDHNLWITDLEKKDSFPLTTDGTEKNEYRHPLKWSPDGTKLALLRVEPAARRMITIVKSSPTDQVQPKSETVEYPKPGDPIDHPRLVLMDVANRRSVPVEDALFPNPWSLDELRWAPDGSRITLLYNQRGHQILRLLAVDAATGAVSTLAEEKSPTFVDYTNKVWFRFLPKTNEILWMSELRSGWNHLYRLDARTGALKNAVTSGEWVVTNVERVDEEKQQIWFAAQGVRSGQDPYYSHLCRANFDGSGFVVLTDGDGTHSWDFSPNGKWIIDRWSRVDQPPTTELRRSDDGKLVCPLEQADWSALLGTGWRPPERFSAKGRDGKTDIFGIIVRPLNFDPKKKYPVVEKIYAGPQGYFVPKSFGLMTRDRMIAELGFIWVQIDGMGTNGRSKAFHDVCWKNLQDAGFPDRIAWIKAAGAKHPELDVSRVGIYGGSAGGQNAMRAVIDHGDFYQVAVADCGCHDNRMDKIWWNEQWMGWPVGPEYEAASNVAQAGRMRGHLLLTWGEADTNVDPASSMQVVNALIKADKDFDMLVLPGENHGAGELPYAARRRMDYFVRHLWKKEPGGS